MAETSIEWTNKTWNPTVGCTRISPGCKNCYAFTLHDMRHAAHQTGKKLAPQYAKPFTELQMIEDRLEDPLHWRKPAMIFVNSVSDLFHADVPDEFIDQVCGIMATCHWHTFQVLTKRADRACSYFQDANRPIKIAAAIARLGSIIEVNRIRGDWSLWSPMIQGIRNHEKWCWPLRNLWLGFSAENQEWFDRRSIQMAPLMRGGWLVWVSAEPLLGPITMQGSAGNLHYHWLGKPGIAWVVTGGESGKGSRPMHPDWARDLRDQCQAAGVPYFFKQFGEFIANSQSDMGDLRRLSEEDCWACDDGTVIKAPGRAEESKKPGERLIRVGKKAAGRLLDGRLHDEFPSVLTDQP